MMHWVRISLGWYLQPPYCSTTVSLRDWFKVNPHLHGLYLPLQPHVRGAQVVDAGIDARHLRLVALQVRHHLVVERLQRDVVWVRGRGVEGRGREGRGREGRGRERQSEARVVGKGEGTLGGLAAPARAQQGVVERSPSPPAAARPARSTAGEAYVRAMCTWPLAQCPVKRYRPPFDTAVGSTWLARPPTSWGFALRKPQFHIIHCYSSCTRRSATSALSFTLYLVHIKPRLSRCISRQFT